MSHRTRWSRAVLIGAATVLITLVAAPPANATPDPAPSTASEKVDPSVRSAAAAGRPTTFWVVLGSEADLSGAATLARKADRTAFVYRTKVDHAERTQAGLRSLLRQRGAAFTPYWIANAVRVTGDASLVSEISARSEVKKIIADGEAEIADPKTDPATAPTATPAVTAVEWGIARIRADQVWTDLSVRGEGVVVANLDTGVQYDHSALAAEYRGRRSDGTYDHSYNWYDPSAQCPTAAPCDDQGHGTHTMGTMAGSTTDGTATIGVAPGARWMAAKACRSNLKCPYDDIVASGQWLTAPTDLSGRNPRPELAPDVVNNSWSTRGSINDVFVPMVQAWTAAGIFPVVSIGNSGPGCGTAESPGANTVSYGVGSFGLSNTISSFSGRGTGENGAVKPDIAAPGESVRSSLPGNRYDTKEGTSMAAPHVAGAVALLWSARPALRGDMAATMAALDNGAVDVADTTCGGTADDNNTYGEGRLDVYAAITGVPVTPVGGLEVQVTDATTGANVADATVTITGPREMVTTSAATGTATFTRPLTGTYSYSVRRYDSGTVTGTVDVAANHTTRITVRLTRLGLVNLTGTVRAGTRLEAGATVIVAGTPLRTTTGSDGRYRLAVPSGTYGLRVDSTDPCVGPATANAPATTNAVVDVSMPARRLGSFGYTCGPAAVGFVTGSTKLDVGSNSDEGYGEATLPFAFPFYGSAYTTVSVSTNGLVTFVGAGTFLTNVRLPSGQPPYAAICPFWDDLAADDQGGIYTATVDGRFVIEWRNVVVFQESPARLSISLVLAPDGSFTFGYRDITGASGPLGVSATVGIQDQSGTDGYTYAHLRPVARNGLGVTFRPPGV